jgi:hypothetical protein
LVAVGGIASALLLIASIVLLSRPSEVIAADGVTPTTTGAPRRFTLRLGQGFRFGDGVVVAGANQDERPDIVFKYVPPQVGGMSLRYNPISQQVETGLEPTLTSPVPLLLSTRINSFEHKPDVTRTTSGDIAAYTNQAMVASKTRYVLLMNQAGDQYLLMLDELEAVPGKYDEWRIGFTYQKVQLPLGLAGGRINKPLPGKLIFRDWYRTKMIVRVDLTSGREEAIVDGILPSTVGERLLGYGDTSSAYIVRDAAGKTLHAIRFNEQVLGPLLSPDGTRLLGSVYRPGPDVRYGDLTMPGAAMLSAGVFDLEGREIVTFRGYDDAAWTPDGKLIATGALYDSGLFEIDPATKSVRPIDATVAAPLQPSVSPDGKTIAFVTGNKVWLIDRAGKNLRQLFPDGRTQQRPVFSPDGATVAFIVCNTLASDVTGEVFVIDLKTNELTPLRTSAGASLVPDTTTRLNWVR